MTWKTVSWEDLSEEHQDEMETIHSSCRQQRLQCFAHSLQLVVRDGLKEKEAFEAQYGANRSIPSAVSMWWNSTVRLVESVTNLDLQSQNTFLEAQGHKSLCLSARERGRLKELVDVLAPFQHLTQGEKVVTLTEQSPHQEVEHDASPGGFSKSTTEVPQDPVCGDLCECQNGWLQWPGSGFSIWRYRLHDVCIARPIILLLLARARSRDQLKLRLRWRRWSQVGIYTALFNN